MRISSRSVEEVREKADIVEVASEFTALRRQGTNLVGLCPYHSEKTPSFSVSPEKNFYHCFGCQKGGDAIKLVMELKSFSFVEAVSHLAERFGVELEFEGHSPEEAKQAERRVAQRRSAYRALAAATIYYHKYLLKSPAAEQARRYLKSRGLEYSTIVEFRLGYAPPRGRSGFMQAARKVGLERGALEAAGLLSARGGERFVDRVTFPISDRRGRIVGFGARTLGDAKPKYLNSPETEIFNKRSLLYGFPQVTEAMRKEKAALVVEGYTDVLMLYQSGIKNAVATLGTAMTEQHLRTLSGHADTVYLLFDPDEAGERAAERTAVTAAGLKLDLRVLRLTEDPADWLLEHTTEEFLNLLSGAMPILKYAIQRITDRARSASSAGRARILQEIKDLIGRIEDSVLYWDGLRLAAESLGMTTEMLLEEFQANTYRLNGTYRPTNLKSELALRFAEIEAGDLRLHKAGQKLLALVLARPDLAARALRQGMAVPEFLNEPIVLKPEDFSDETQARIFALLAEHSDLETVLSDERARPLLDEISALRAAGERLVPAEASLRAAWLRLRLLNHERAKQTLRDPDHMDDEAWVRRHRQLYQETQALKAATAAIEAEPDS